MPMLRTFANQSLYCATLLVVISMKLLVLRTFADQPLHFGNQLCKYLMGPPNMTHAPQFC
jgi:hypothetical protein